MKMPPPLKLVVTSEHEEALWKRKFLNADTSLGLIQAVIFYLIKCFGLWQGKDLKLLKTEHVSFSEDNIGKFITIDVKMAVGSGKVVKRYDDPDNPRSVYKILKTYKGYLANEGPFLVRPISSIKDYICYSPWPLGVNVIEQTVANLMQECGVGPGFGNISVCLMAIEILKSFGAGSHCISTWMFRLYPRYKKTFWADIFKKCCTINCEDKSPEVCLMISHVLDPPYPAATLLVEMRQKQEMIKNKMETVNSQRTRVFNSWLSNINCTKEKEFGHALDQGNELLDGNACCKTKVTLKAAGVTKGQSILESRTQNVMEKNLSQREKSSDGNFEPRSVCSLSLCEPPQVTVKTELMTDLDSFENKSDSSDVKIMTVLSIPESAYSSQIDEAECAVNENQIGSVSTSTNQVSRNAAAGKGDHSSVHTRNIAVKRKFKCSKDSVTVTEPKVKLSKTCIKNEEMEDSNPCDDNEVPCGLLESDVVVEGKDPVTSLCTDVKLELDSDCDGITDYHEMVLNEEMKQLINVRGGSNTCGELCQSENDGPSLPLTGGSTSCEKGSLSPQDGLNNLQQRYRTSQCISDRPVPGVVVTHNEGSCMVKARNLISEAAVVPLTFSSSFLKASSCNQDQTKDNSEILQKWPHNEKESSMKVPASGGSNELEKESKMLCTVNESSSAIIIPKTCIIRNNREEVKLTTACLYHTSFRDRDIANVENSYATCSNSGITCMDMGSMALNHTKCSGTGEEPVSQNNTRNSDHYRRDGHLATDIVKFLDAAQKQLQNILQTSTTCANQDYVHKDTALDASLQSSNASKTNRRHGLVKDMKSGIKSKATEKVACDLKSHVTRSNSSHQTPKETESQKSPFFVKDRSCPLLRSVLEEPRSPIAKTRLRSLPTTLTASKHLSRAPRINWNKKRFVPVRLKTPQTLQTQLELDIAEKRYYGSHSNKQLSRSFRKMPRRRKDHMALKQFSIKGATLNNGKTACDCKLNQHKLPETVHLHSGADCHDASHIIASSNMSSSSSLLVESSGDSDTRCGIYHYQSNHQENAVYQMMQIKQENQGTHTFTISDLPVHDLDSGSQRSHLNCPRSEICLGDYFPEGTVIPARGVRLITRKSTSGLEVVLKFDFNLLENIKSSVNNVDNDDKELNLRQDEDNSSRVKDS